jgi:hypothetical protein
MKNFEPGSILKQSDYQNNRDQLGLIAVLCAGAIAFFVLKLAGAI